MNHKNIEQMEKELTEKNERIRELEEAILAERAEEQRLNETIATASHAICQLTAEARLLYGTSAIFQVEEKGLINGYPMLRAWRCMGRTLGFLSRDPRGLPPPTS